MCGWGDLYPLFCGLCNFAKPLKNLKGNFQVIVCFSVCALGRSLCIRREWGERTRDEPPGPGASDTGGWRDVHNYRRHGAHWREQLVIDLIIPVSLFERTDLAITSLLANQPVASESERARNQCQSLLT